MAKKNNTNNSNLDFSKFLDVNLPKNFQEVYDSLLRSVSLSDLEDEGKKVLWSLSTSLTNLYSFKFNLASWKLPFSDEERIKAFIQDFTDYASKAVSENPLLILEVSASISEVLSGMVDALIRGAKKVNLFNWDATKEFRLYCDTAARKYLSKDSRYRILRKI